MRRRSSQSRTRLQRDHTGGSLWPDVLVAGCGDIADTVGAVPVDAASGAGDRAVALRAGLAAITVSQHRQEQPMGGVSASPDRRNLPARATAAQLSCRR